MFISLLPLSLDEVERVEWGMGAKLGPERAQGGSGVLRATTEAPRSNALKSSGSTDRQTKCCRKPGTRITQVRQGVTKGTLLCMWAQRSSLPKSGPWASISFPFYISGQAGWTTRGYRFLAFSAAIFAGFPAQGCWGRWVSVVLVYQAGLQKQE